MTLKISIIIPAYNSQDHIEECVSSLLGQSYGDFEIVIVDDESTDNTANLIDNLALQDKRINALHVSHGGASAARNAGIEVAKGDYMFFIDADDALVPDALDILATHLCEKIDMLWFGFLYLGQNGEIHKGDELPKIYYPNAAEAVADWIRNDMLPQSACNKVYRASVIKDFGIRFRNNVEFGEDRLFNIDFLTHCGAIEIISENLYIYRLRDGSASHRFVPGMLSQLIIQHEENLGTLLPLCANILSTDEQIAFAQGDFVKRVKAAWKHLGKYYSTLSYKQQRNELQQYLEIDIPEDLNSSSLQGLTSKWFHVFKSASKANSLLMLKLMMALTSFSSKKLQ